MNMIDITPDQDGGVIKILIKEGEGDFPLPGSCVKIFHNLFKIDGTGVEENSNWDYKFRLNNTENITWNMCISTMKKGEWASFVCHPEYTLIENQSMDFPHEIIILTVVLCSWKGEDLFRDGGVERYHTLNFGRPNSSPKDDSFVGVHIIGQYEGNIFDERNVSFIHSSEEYCEVNVIEGVAFSLIEFNEGETSRLKIQPEYAFGTEGCTEWGIPPNATVDYTVTLTSIEKLHSLSREEVIQQAELFKQRATVYFEYRKVELSFTYYFKTCKYLLKDLSLNDDLSERRKDLLHTTWVKISLLALYNKHYIIAYTTANIILCTDPKNVEVLLLRGKAYSHLAAEDFKRVLELDPTNVKAQMRLKKLLSKKCI